MTYKLILYTLIVIALYEEVFAIGGFQPGAFIFFTIQSNILVALFLFLSIVMYKKNRAVNQLRGISLFAVLITGIMYNFILHKAYLEWGTYAYSLSRTITHIVSPTGFFLDWLLFDEHGYMKWKDVFIWAAYPLVYCLILLFTGMRFGIYLYSFLDASYGYALLIKRLGLISFALFVIGLLTVGLDNAISQKRRKKK